MIKIRYPLSGEQHELFNDHVEALCKQLSPHEYKNDNIQCFYCRSDEIDDIYLVYFDYNVVADVDIIVHWNGERMSYQAATGCKAFTYETKKSLKDTCLELMDDLEHTVLHLQSWPAAKHHLPLNIELLRKNIEAMEDNT